MVDFIDSTFQIVATDTVWFGCDSAGDYGIQPNLDKIATEHKENTITSYDTTLSTETELKHNIIGFKKNTALTFIFNCYGAVENIRWDLSDIKNYPATPNFFLKTAYLYGTGICFDTWHADFRTLFFRPNPTTYESSGETINIICGKFNSFFRLDLIFTDTTKVNSLKQEQTAKFQVYQQQDAIQIEFTEQPGAIYDVQLHNIEGKKLLESKEIRNKKLFISTTEFPKGFLILSITSENGTTIKKIINY